MQVILDSLLFSLRACVLLDQRPGNATALDQEFLVPVQLIVCVRWRFFDEMNKFSTANQIWPSFRWAFSLAQGSRSLVQTEKDRSLWGRDGRLGSVSIYSGTGLRFVPLLAKQCIIAVHPAVRIAFRRQFVE